MGTSKVAKELQGGGSVSFVNLDCATCEGGLVFNVAQFYLLPRHELHVNYMTFSTTSIKFRKFFFNNINNLHVWFNGIGYSN
jgi:hypothetical protein